MSCNRSTNTKKRRSAKRREPYPEITQEMLEKYVGGQFEWFDLIDNSESFAGIEAFVIEGDSIWFHFSWVIDVIQDAKGTGYQQEFNLPKFPVNFSNPFKILQLESKDGTRYEVIEITEHVGAYIYRLYPPWELGLDIGKLKELKTTLPPQPGRTKRIRYS